MAKRGRPIEYRPRIIKKVREYIKQCQDDMVQLVRQSNTEKGYEMYDNKLKVNLPTIEGLALFLKIHKSTIYDWANKYPDFSDVIDELLAKQAQELVNKGLSGQYNPTIAKVLLTKHGYREGSEISGPEGGPIETKGIPDDEFKKIVGIYAANRGEKV